MKKEDIKLEKNELWQEANTIAEYMYGKLAELPTEEMWDTKRKLRSASNDLIFYVAQAVGGTNNEYDWSYARKTAFSLKTMYRFAHKQGFIEVDPAIMVKIDKLINQLDQGLEATKEDIKQNESRELDGWMKKYEIWKKMNK